MRLRHTMPVLLLTAACALMAGAVSAQTVFVSPGGNSSQTNQNPQPTPPVVTPAPSTRTTTPPLAAPTTGAVRQTTPGATTNQRTEARTGLNLPPERPLNRSDDIGLRHLGIQPRPDAAHRMLQTYTPDEIERIRQRYDELGKRNPNLAGYNPIDFLELMSRTREAQDALSDRINAACTSGSIRVMISQTSFKGRRDAEANLDKNGLTPLGNALADVCSDPTQRRDMSRGIFMITIFHAPGQEKANLFADNGILTLSDDFTRAEGMPATQMKSLLRDAIKEAAASRSHGGTMPAEDAVGHDH